MNRARAVLTALSLLAALGLAGCSDDDPEPKFEPTPSATPSSAETTEAAVLETPEDVVRAWVAAQNEAATSGDVRELKSLSTTNCRGCESFIEVIEDTYENGGHIETDGWEVVAAKVRDGNLNRVDAGIEMAAGKNFPGDGEDPVRFKADKVIMTFGVTGERPNLQVDLVAFVE